MNMFSVGGKHWPPADQSPQDGEAGLENRQSERNDGDGDGDDGWSFLRSLKRQRTQHEADKQAATVSQKNSGGIEVETQEPENRASQGQGHQRNQGGTIEECNDKNHQGGKQRGTRSEPVEPVDQVKSVGNGQDPQNRKWQSYEPREMMVSKDHRKIEDP